MNETETARKITAYLDRGTAQLKAGTAYRLQLARQAALDAAAEPQRCVRARPGRRFDSARTAGDRPLLRQRAALDRHSAHRRRVRRLPNLADGAATKGYRGNRCGASDLGAAHRSISGPGIPELAETIPALSVRPPPDSRPGLRYLCFRRSCRGGAADSTFAGVERALPGRQASTRSARRRLGQARGPAQAEVAQHRQTLSDPSARPAAAHPGSR